MFAKIRINLSIVAFLSILAACSAPSPSTPPTDLRGQNLIVTATSTDVPSTPQSATSTQTGSSFDCQNAENIPVEECRALVALYQSTNGENWADRSGWLVTETPCTWYGVMCYQGHVTSLYLSHNQLSGAIPVELGDLSQLNWLDLSHNQLDGLIPAELESVTALHWLDLSYNHLTGAVSTGMAEALWEDLRLWGNLLDGTVAVSKEPVTSVEFQGAQFAFPSSLAESVWPEIRAALPASEVGPAWAVPEHIRFTFAGPAKPDSFRFDWVGPAGHPQLLIYPTQEFSTKSELAKGEIGALQRLLKSRPPVPEGEIPLLPLSNNAQVFHAQVQYLDFQNGSGVRFITHYTQEVVGRLTKQNVFYTFQGLTRDGKYYVAAFFPITSPGLRDEMLEEPWDVAQARLAEDIQHLDSLSPQAFEPDLQVLDGIIESLVVDTP